MNINMLVNIWPESYQFHTKRGGANLSHQFGTTAAWSFNFRMRHAWQSWETNQHISVNWAWNANPDFYF